ncbi:hypothetical protein AB2M62_19050 [Sphingomonas sp. MMS12-HWE2-04]|uniref:hypothetical protein n=1 Tax=Sphingomonas sp. MMS12-HWE2-04 TaxID=3234199 RepID=UPI003850CD8A
MIVAGAAAFSADFTMYAFRTPLGAASLANGPGCDFLPAPFHKLGVPANATVLDTNANVGRVDGFDRTIYVEATAFITLTDRGRVTLDAINLTNARSPVQGDAQRADSVCRLRAEILNPCRRGRCRDVPSLNRFPGIGTQR